MLITRSLVALLAFLLVGCGDIAPTDEVADSPSPRPDYIWRLSPADMGPIYLLVHDEPKILIGMRTERLNPGRDDSIWWEPMQGDADSLELGWLGGVCSDPTLQIAREGQAVWLTIQEGAAPASCPAVGVEYQVVLTLPYPIAEFDISVHHALSPTND